MARKSLALLLGRAKLLISSFAPRVVHHLAMATLLLSAQAMSAEREAKGKASCRETCRGSGSPSAQDALKTAVPGGNTIAAVAVAAKGRRALEMTLPSSPRASSPRRRSDAMLHESPETETRG